CTARSGYWSATEANATNRSGYLAQNSASRSFWILTTWVAMSRSARYQRGLMLSASMSMPCASISRRRRRPTSSIPGPRWSSTRSPSRAYASGITQCACTSTVLTRRPPTTTSRRRPDIATGRRCPAGLGRALPRAAGRARMRESAAPSTSHPVKAMVAMLAPELRDHPERRAAGFHALDVVEAVPVRLRPVVPRRSRAVRRQRDVRKRHQRVVRLRRLLHHHVETRGGDRARRERPMQRVLVDDRTPTGVDEDRGLL